MFSILRSLTVRAHLFLLLSFFSSQCAEEDVPDETPPFSGLRCVPENGPALSAMPPVSLPSVPFPPKRKHIEHTDDIPVQGLILRKSWLFREPSGGQRTGRTISAGERVHIIAFGLEWSQSTGGIFSYSGEDTIFVRRHLVRDTNGRTGWVNGRDIARDNAFTPWNIRRLADKRIDFDGDGEVDDLFVGFVNVREANEVGDDLIPGRDDSALILQRKSDPPVILATSSGWGSALLFDEIVVVDINQDGREELLIAWHESVTEVGHVSGVLERWGLGATGRVERLARKEVQQPGQQAAGTLYGGGFREVGVSRDFETREGDTVCIDGFEDHYWGPDLTRHHRAYPLRGRITQDVWASPHPSESSKRVHLPAETLVQIVAEFLVYGPSPQSRPVLVVSEQGTGWVDNQHIAWDFERVGDFFQGRQKWFDPFRSRIAPRDASFEGSEH
ncbi:MAG: hypothetical protein AAFV53_25810 [Myxococcota bacterium]